MPLEHGMMVDGHLGGYVPGGDPDSVTPKLWRWLTTTLRVETVLDVGAGDGIAVDGFLANGADAAVGVDGMPVDHPDVVQHDFTEGVWCAGRPHRYDLVWCCETLEHVEEEYLPNVLAVFLGATWVALTHATPGQPGWHHVNCQTDDYWRGAMATISYRYEEQLTRDARQVARRERATSYFASTGMIFRRLP